MSGGSALRPRWPPQPIIEEPLYKGPQKIKLREILLYGPTKKMNKHFCMTALKMKRKATFSMGSKKNDSKENSIIWFNQK
jgi:hypothetical protein